MSILPHWQDQVVMLMNRLQAAFPFLGSMCAQSASVNSVDIVPCMASTSPHQLHCLPPGFRTFQHPHRVVKRPKSVSITVCCKFSKSTWPSCFFCAAAPYPFSPKMCTSSSCCQIWDKHKDQFQFGIVSVSQAHVKWTKALVQITGRCLSMTSFL